MPEFLIDSDFERFRNLIYDASGIHFSSTNRSILESRLKERLKRSGLETIDKYFRLIKGNEDELKTLLDSVTTNLTRFFRNTAHFQTFENVVIPDLVERKRSRGDKKLRIWSAGCSTGEEPYTIAMILSEILPPDFSYEIVASDISLKSVMIGKEGYYSDNRMNGVPPEYLNKYFTRMEGGYQITDAIKSRIRFDYHNLKNDSGLRNLDIVFCRNVLIYFDETAQKAVVERFYETLAAYAYLYIGHSESLFGMGTKFEFVKTDWACVYRKSE
ncbi:CheR family methyltransferase [Spirochaeta dissipatitropha]